MCGRFSQLPSQSPFQVPRPNLAPEFLAISARYNVAPSQTAQILIKRSADIEMLRMQWGLLPFWAKELNLASHTFNARMDSVDSKPSFRAAFKARHAVVPVSGYYEWQTTANGKQPYYFQAENTNEYLWLAGLWEPRHTLQTDDSDGSFTLITQEATGIPASVHTRMPIFLAEDEIETWLTLSAGPSMPFLLTRSLPAIRVQPVSKRVNTPRQDDEGLIAPL